MRVPLLSRATGFIGSIGDRRARRRAVARLRSGVARLSRDAGADDVVDFLFAGDAALIEPWQIPEEFGALARLVEQRRPRTIVEIGTADGGSLFTFARLAAADALLISIDLPGGPFGGGYPAWRIPLYESFAGAHQRLELIRADSHAEATADLLESLLQGRRIDFAFIDGDHSYDGVRRDFDLCLRFAAAGGIIAFHDIVERPNPEYMAESGATRSDDWAVHRFWREVRDRYANEQFVHHPDQAGYGIGVLHLGDAPHADKGR